MLSCFARLFLGVSCVALVVGGCAKNEIVKKDEPATASTPKSVNTESVTSEPSGNRSVKNSSSEDGATYDTLEPIPNTGELMSVLEEIYFDFDKYALSRKARDTLSENVEILKNDTIVTVRIEGHCDERGSDDYNLALGERRAGAAMRYLVTMGISPDRLSVISYGKEKPVAPGHDEAAWAKNRRDEFVIMTK